MPEVRHEVQPGSIGDGGPTPRADSPPPRPSSIRQTIDRETPGLRGDVELGPPGPQASASESDAPDVGQVASRRARDVGSATDPVWPTSLCTAVDADFAADPGSRAVRTGPVPSPRPLARCAPQARRASVVSGRSGVHRRSARADDAHVRHIEPRWRARRSLTGGPRRLGRAEGAASGRWRSAGRPSAQCLWASRRARPVGRCAGWPWPGARLVLGQDVQDHQRDRAEDDGRDRSSRPRLRPKVGAIRQA